MYVLIKDIEKYQIKEVKPIHKMSQRPEIPLRYVKTTYYKNENYSLRFGKKSRMHFENMQVLNLPGFAKETETAYDSLQMWLAYRKTPW